MRVYKRRARDAHIGGFGCATAVVSLLVIATLVILASIGVTLLLPNNSGASASLLHPQNGSIRWTGSRFTTLVITTTSTSPQTGVRDDLHIVSFRPHARSLHVLTIPGNLWVTVPGFGQTRAADAYVDGGPRLALLTAQSITHVVIPYYVVLTDDVLKQAIDSVNGITLHVSEADSLPTGRTAGGADAAPLQSGTHHLNGSQAVHYFRAQQPGAAGEFAHLRREQQVLRAAGGALVARQNLFRLPALIDSIAGNLTTNVPYDQIPVLVRSMSSVPQNAVREERLEDVNNTVTAYTQGGQDVLLPDWFRIRSLAQALFPDHSLSAGPPVRVVNGSGVAGQAAALASWLELTHIRVGALRSARSNSVLHTEVVLSPHSGKRLYALARAIGILLQVPVTTQVHAQGSAAITIIIGRDFQDLTQR